MAIYNSLILWFWRPELAVEISVAGDKIRAAGAAFLAGQVVLGTPWTACQIHVPDC